MLTDIELLELEVLLVQKYQSHIFGLILHNEETNEIISSQKDLYPILGSSYPGRYKIDEKENIVISMDLFKLIKYRFFSRNKTAFYIATQ